MKRIVLFTGLIRDRDRLSAMLRTVEAYRATHDPIVLLSTWRHEIGRWPGLDAELAAAKVRVVVQEEPGPRERGHLLHQLLAIDAGLALCDPDDFVLKTRFDLGSENEVRAFFRSEPPEPTGPSSPFAARTSIGGFFGAQPFYIGDVTFSGFAKDLRKMSAMPVSALAAYSWVTSTEQMIWGPSFAALHPEIAIYFRVNPGLIFNNPDRQDRIRRGLMASRLYHRALARAYVAMEDSFRWLWAGVDDAEVAEACRARTLEDLLWSKDVVTGIRHHAGCATNFVAHRAVARILATGAYAASPFGDAVAEMVDLHRSGSARAAVETLLAEADSLFQVAAAEPGLGGTVRHFVRNPDMASITGALPDWLAERAAVDTVHYLETQMAGLRRVNDQLIAQLRTLGAQAMIAAD